MLRTGPPNWTQLRLYFARFWSPNERFRIVCAEAQNHGAMLAQVQGRRTTETNRNGSFERIVASDFLV